MKDQLKDYMTIPQAADAVGCSRRTIYRVLERAGADAFITEALGMRLIHRSKIAALRAAYLPFGSERHSEAAKAYGHLGGTQKRLNREEAAG